MCNISCLLLKGFTTKQKCFLDKANVDNFPLAVLVFFVISICGIGGCSCYLCFGDVAKM